MSENLTGKYLDGAGLSKVWEKVKSYSSSNYLPLGGGNISGNLKVGGILSVTGEATFTNNVTAKGFKVGNQTGFLKANGTIDDTNYLPLTGGTTDFLNSTKITVGNFGQLTGGENDGFDLYVIGSAYAKYFSAMQVNLSGSITSNKQATTKKYVDDKVSTVTSSLGNYLPLSGGSISGNLSVGGILNVTGGTPTEAGLIATSIDIRNFVTIGTPPNTDTLASVGSDPVAPKFGLYSYIPAHFEGGLYCATISSDSITLSSAITSDNQATTKKYVDDKVSTSLGNYLPLTGGTLTGPLTSEGLMVKDALLVGTDGGGNMWDADVSMRYGAGYFVGQTIITSGLGDGEVSINIIPKAAGDDGKGRIDISGPQITFNDIDQTNKGITFTPTLATFNVPTSATSITLSSAITQDTQATTKKYVDDKVSTAISSLNEVLKFKGSINSTSALPTSAELGWTYMVSEGGTYAGEICEVGDMIICTTASTTAPTWTIIQRNIPGVMSNDEIDSICTY